MMSDKLKTTGASSLFDHSLHPLSAWQSTRELGFAAALWRLPHQKDKHLIVNFGSELPRTRMMLDELPAGFAMSPFLNIEGDNSLFIEADLYFRFDENGEATLEQESAYLSAPNREKWYNHYRNRPANASSLVIASDSPRQPELPNFAYLEAVQKAIKAIEAGAFKKVVFSRVKQVELATDFTFSEVFERLCEKYPTAFVSMVYLPQLDQVWLGATPETLVSVDKEGIFRTVSLAGTQSAFDASGAPISVKKAAWTQKEIEEQALVGRYIISCFKKIRVREYLEEGPKTVVAGNLMHLRSDYLVDTKTINFPELGTVMLELLHPTSAVCGMPKMEALAFIQQHEGYNREFYSGYLGPVNVGNETHLFVNLRCMKIQNNVATLYAGGGITEDSEPEKEWQETEMKCQTMLSVLG
ncbi:isochorismate synthase [Runella defluvii]|uniref:isochorismate synthase n=1 Tax=Runella defluvii TaxID=370973 RepID=A0A7W6ETC3_9BACT|nr:chorismate-binding protein [Runella defluvii]MBB3841573.1 isochorismate synthase [Runella defluvii]